ncbi:hypothetical protein SAMN02982929_00172 [Saccharopolyspora kobensis]|uniref:Uncharacterized protein n=1 Tax=Saccharopolyspora kobensis TaxID=146035 RepID=A0A1H5TAC4_9PSEU|nr:DUF6220 domain-containing protein [Saccharopolyspora kobensis]SEF59773.1 hypothetical protein SAMN02982929_00172 [Saccharopolyspora kobensis]SFC48323.1 hypothetical protein SAMN05216506_101860 [Saccharopolyspora kobensis]
MRKVFAVLAALLLLAVIVQFYLAASGAFDAAPIEESFEPHRLLGNVVLGYSVVLTVFAAVARVPGRLIGMTGLVAGLVLVQSLIREVANALGDASSAGHLVFGLHAINGLVIVSLIATIARRARQIAWQPAETALTTS